MRFLLDIHILLWFLENDTKLTTGFTQFPVSKILVFYQI